MTMQTSGEISIGQAMAECGLTGEQDAGAALLSKLAGVNPGQQYAWSYWYEKSNGIKVVEGTIQLEGVDMTFGSNVSFSGVLDVCTSITGSTGTFAIFEGSPSSAPGSIPTTPWSGAAPPPTIQSICRFGQILNIYALNCSLDGLFWSSSLGEVNLPLTNNTAKTTNVGAGKLTCYAVKMNPLIPFPGRGVSRSYTASITGTVARPQPAPT